MKTSLHLAESRRSSAPAFRVRAALRTWAPVMFALWSMCTLVLPLAHATPPNAASVLGTISDGSGALIAGAKVIFSSGNQKIAQLTDEGGAFAFTGVSARSGSLEISASGFASKRVEWNRGSAPLKIVLDPATVASEITVTAARMGVPVAQTPASVVVLAPGDLAATSALTVDATLRQVAGFSTFRRSDSRTANPTTEGVSLRGLGGSGASRALVLDNGTPLGDPFGGWVYWDRIPRADIGSIEVLSGGGSYLYGSDALGGVINVRRRPVDQDALSMDLGYGNENTPELSLAGSKKLGPWAMGVDGEAFRTDGYIDVPSVFRGLVDTPVTSRHGTGEVTVARDFGQIANVFVRGSLFGEDRHNGTPLQTNSTTVRELTAGGDWFLGSFGSLQVHGYASRQNFDQTFSSIAQDRNSETLVRAQRVPAQRIGFSAQWARNLGTRNTLVAGTEQWDTHGYTKELIFIPGRLNFSDAGGREVNWAGYIEDVFRITPAWSLTLSGRVDHWQNFDAFSATQHLLPVQSPIAGSPFANRSETFFSPRIAALRKLNRNVSLTTAVYRSYRAPTLNELYRDFRVGNILTDANANLTAERLTGGEAGAIITGWNQQLLMRGTFFWADTADPIANVTLSSTPALITRQRQNLGSTRSRGVEINVSGQLNRSISVSGGFQYADATVTSFPADPTLVGLDVPQVPRHNFTFQVRYSKPFLLAGLQGRFVGDQFDDDQNTLPLRRYFTMDLWLSHPLYPGIEIFGAAENLLNSRYDIGRTPVLTVGPPILARVGLRLQFGAR